MGYGSNAQSRIHIQFLKVGFECIGFGSGAQGKAQI